MQYPTEILPAGVFAPRGREGARGGRGAKEQRDGGDGGERRGLRACAWVRVTCDPDVASVVDEHVLGLQVAEDDVEVVEILKGQHGLGRKEPGLFEREPTLLLLLDVGEHLCDG